MRELEDSPLSGRFLSSNDSSSVRSPWFISPGRKKCSVSTCTVYLHYYQWFIEPWSGKRAYNGLSTHIDCEIRNVTKTFNEQASTGTFVPRVMATYCHAKPLLAIPKGPEGITNCWDE